MKVKSEISINLGHSVKALRIERGLSLSQLSKDTGISKAMLSQIERFESSPTVELLWKLSQGLNIEYTALLNSKEANLMENAIDHEGAIFTPVYASKEAKKTEVFHISFAPFNLHTREAHKNVAEESITVLEGQLEVFYDGKWHLVKSGEQIKFNADQEHGYKTTQTPAKFINILEYK
ncbi:helix-turn-helix domain-containing protein [Pseudoalteromonas sp. T1lg65]|uniref:helix-turn-helix domain-containing protein n=1 Tax=Pseudoalteromonas sp. T1lg65 TaxID=2077101 RepID=UPI003F7A7CA2